MPPRAVRMPSAAFIPLMSSGLVSSRTRSTFSPRSAHSNASCAVKTTRPVAAPGPALRPVREDAARRHRLFLGRRVEDGPQQLVQGIRVHAQDRLLGRDALLVDHLDGDPHLGEARALARARLEHPELALLHRELDVLHVAVVVFERPADAEKLLVDLRHLLLERRDLLRRPDARDDVLALRVDEVLAVEDVLARGGVAGERDARAAVVAEVAEDHRLDVHRGAPALGNSVELAVDLGALVHPRAEDGADRSPELLHRIVREDLPGAVPDLGLEIPHELLQRVDRQLRIEAHAVRQLFLLEDDLEGVPLVPVNRFQAEDDVAVHRHEAAVAVPGEAGVLRDLRQTLDRPVVQAEVEDRVHHAGHRRPGAGPHRYC